MSLFDTLLPWRKLSREHEEILMKLSDVDEFVGLVGAQLAKAKTEILAKQDSLLARIDDLEAALANQDLPPEAEAALEAVKAEAQALDDIVPDALPTE